MTALARLKRRVDRRFYRLLFRLYRALFPAPAAGRPIRRADVKRLLVARTDRVGDIVVFTPTLAYLREALPHAEIDVATSSAASLLTGDPRVNNVYVHQRGFRGWLRAVRAARARRYDVILSVRLRDHLAESIFAALAAPRHAARVSAYRRPEFAGLFTHLVRVPYSRRHIIDRLIYIAQTALGDRPQPPGAVGRYPAALVEAPAAAARAEAFVADSCGGRPFVAFNAWGSDPRRCFGVEVAAAIAAGIAAHHPELVVVLTPAPPAAAEAHAIARAALEHLGQDPGRRAAPPRVAVAPTSSDLRDLVELLRRAAVVLTPDTANMHIAAALGTPLLAVYTSYTAVDVWGAWGAPRHVLHVPGDRAIREIPPDDVVRAFDVFWGELRSPARSPAASR